MENPRFQSCNLFTNHTIVFLETSVLLFEAVVALVFVYHMERQLFDLSEQPGLHFADVGAFLLHFRCGRNVGEMVVFVDVSGDLGQRREAVAGLKDIVGAGGGDDHFLGADCPCDVQQVLW